MAEISRTPANRFVIEIEGARQGDSRIYTLTNLAGLETNTEVEEGFRVGGSCQSVDLAGVTRFNDLTMEKALDEDDWMRKWRAQVYDRENGGGKQTGFRRNLTVYVLNKEGVPILKYVVHDAWPSTWAQSDLDAKSSDTLKERITVKHSGWAPVQLTGQSPIPCYENIAAYSIPAWPAA